MHARIPAILLLVPLAVAGLGHAARADDAELRPIAEEACRCLEKPHAKAAEMVERVKSARASGDTTTLMRMQGEMIGLMSVAQRCFDELEEKHPEVAADEARSRRVGELTDELCPNPAEAFVEGRPD